MYTKNRLHRGLDSPRPSLGATWSRNRGFKVFATRPPFVAPGTVVAPAPPSSRPLPRARRPRGPGQQGAEHETNLRCFVICFATRLSTRLLLNRLGSPERDIDTWPVLSHTMHGVAVVAHQVMEATHTLLLCLGTWVSYDMFKLFGMIQYLTLRYIQVRKVRVKYNTNVLPKYCQRLKKYIVLFHRNTLLHFLPISYLVYPIYWEHLSQGISSLRHTALCSSFLSTSSTPSARVDFSSKRL